MANIEFGTQRVADGVDGAELLAAYEKRKKRKAGDNDGVDIGDDVQFEATRILTDEDLKKIKILKLKQGVKHIDRHGFSAGVPEDEID